MTKLVLTFAGHSAPELDKTCFEHEALARGLCAYRGKTAGAHAGGGSFQWSPAVRALTILLLRTAAWSKETPASRGPLPILSGHAGSAASSLDYALGKQPLWMMDMFGCSRQGTSHARRIIYRTNPERRRPGPVELAINPKFLQPGAIEVRLDERELASAQELHQMAECIERQDGRGMGGDLQSEDIGRPHGRTGGNSLLQRSAAAAEPLSSFGPQPHWTGAAVTRAAA